MYGNYFYKNKETGVYSPAELAIVKFTFRGGISERFHTHICPGECERGFIYVWH